MKTFFFFFFGEHLRFVSLVLGLGLEHSCPWPRECLSSERLSLASDFFCVLGLGLGLEPCVLDSTSGILFIALRIHYRSILTFSWNEIFYLLINDLHHHYVIDDVINQKYCSFAVSQNKLRFHKKNIHFQQLLNNIMKIIRQYSKIL